MAEFASNGKGNLGVTLGAIGTGLGALSSGIIGGNGGILGGWGNGWNGGGYGGYHDHFIDRYEAGQQARIAELETEVKLRDANIYTDGKSLELFRYVDGRLREIEGQICAQAVQNQKTADAFEMVRNDIVCCKNELYSAIGRERDERCCSDNAIVRYVNATFYPKQVADVTVGATTTAQFVYNPLPEEHHHHW